MAISLLQGGIAAALTSKLGGETLPDPEPAAPVIDNKVRQDWNDYTDWLAKKGLKGSPELDKNDLGGKMIDEYRKANPATSVSRDMVVPIQKEFSKYRDTVLDQVKAGKAKLDNGVTPDNFMLALSKVDGVPGQRTTSFAFPKSYLESFVDNKLVKKTNQGFNVLNK